MRIVVGLGNPGSAYERTRHNAGFIFMDKLASEQKASWKKAYDCELASIQHNGEKVLLFKPMTYMNCSGGPLKK